MLHVCVCAHTCVRSCARAHMCTLADVFRSEVKIQDFVFLPPCLGDQTWFIRLGSAFTYGIISLAPFLSF